MPVHGHSAHRGFLPAKRLASLGDTGEAHCLSAATEARHGETHITRIAQQDDLTGLANRALFRERLTNALASARQRGEPVALICVDLDGFKAINDTLGPNSGDALLLSVAELLRATGPIID